MKELDNYCAHDQTAYVLHKIRSVKQNLPHCFYTRIQIQRYHFKCSQKCF